MFNPLECAKIGLEVNTGARVTTTAGLATVIIAGGGLLVSNLMEDDNPALNVKKNNLGKIEDENAAVVTE